MAGVAAQACGAYAAVGDPDLIRRLATPRSYGQKHILWRGLFALEFFNEALRPSRVCSVRRSGVVEGGA